VFDPADRAHARDRLLELAAADARVAGAAALGSLAHGSGDRFSDLDLMLAVAAGGARDDVVADFTAAVVGEFDGVQLFDLPSGPILYRVFLLPGCLQLDLSFVPAESFGASGPRFRALFGETVELPQPPQRSADDAFGWGAAYARDARACIERGRLWQARHCLDGLRDHALVLACLARGLPTSFGRGFDDLPAEALEPFAEAQARTLEPAELRRAFAVALEGLLREAEGRVPAAARAAPRLRLLLDG
jgi:hypothetical protein